MIKRGKKGQLTLFIIIAAVVVAVAAITIFFWPSISGFFMSQQQAQQFLASQAEPLRDAVAECIYKISYPAFETIGLQAGYYDTTGMNFIYFGGKDHVVVMFKDAAKQRINKLPSLTQIENQYQMFLNDKGNAEIDKCLNNFAAFKRVMNVEPGERKISALIYPDVVILEVDWPITISKRTARAEARQTINQKPVTLLMPLGYMWQTANKVVDCETQVDCKYEGIKWDEDAWNNPHRLHYISRDARSITENQIVFILESVPYRQGEMPYKFNFAIDRS
ncbi:MAG: hypothetical protein N3G19_03710 [Candidatus Pacearchaeota archaeon]|nr:hypothetical protein [Candidatus Pacearchaeota archaeon]